MELINMRLGYIYNELQLLTCLKHGLWATNKKYKYFKGDLIALISMETYVGFVAVGRIYGEPFELEEKLWQEHNYKFLYKIEFLHILPLNEREKFTDQSVKVLFDIRPGYNRDQKIIEEIYGQLSLKQSKITEKFIMKKLGDFPNVLGFYKEEIDALIKEAELRPEMHWNGSHSLPHENLKYALDFPLKDFDINNNKDKGGIEPFSNNNKHSNQLRLDQQQLTIEVTKTEEERLIKTRIGQDKFRRALLNGQRKCVMCGMDVEELLVASHIKSWRDSTNDERLDINNGIILCANHDALFDKGFITFNDNGNILVSKRINENQMKLLNIDENMKINFNETTKLYMKSHRSNYFNGSKSLNE